MCEIIGSQVPPYAPLALLAWKGPEAEATTLIEETEKDAVKRGETMAISAARWASAVFHNGLGNHEKALEAAEWAWNNGDLGYADWSLPELILAAVRVGDTAQAGEALQQLAGRAHDSQSEWAMGIEARCRALLSEGTQAEQLYGEAIERLSRTRVKVELARTHLQYGEWLRRERRKLDARAQLESAYDAEQWRSSTRSQNIGCAGRRPTA